MRHLIHGHVDVEVSPTQSGGKMEDAEEKPVELSHREAVSRHHELK